MLPAEGGSALQLLFLARKNLGASRWTTALLVAAVAAGVGFQIPNAANMAGYERELLREGISAGHGDVRVRPRAGRRAPPRAPVCGWRSSASSSRSGASSAT